jgi:cobalt/nickel transport protein
MNKLRNLLLIAAVVLVAVSLFLPKSSDSKKAFTGTDDQAKDAIEDLRPGYVPWFNPIWKPPSDEVETLLFTLQAAIGAGVLGYVIGNLQGRAARAGQIDGRC